MGNNYRILSWIRGLCRKRNRIERITGADTGASQNKGPRDEWFATECLSKTDKTEMMNDFASSVRVQLDVMLDRELGQGVAKEGMTIAIRICT